MARYSRTLRDQYNRPVGGASVYVTISPNDSLATLTNDDGSSLSNPFTTSSSGAVVFNATNGLYDVVYWLGGRKYREDFGVSIGNVVQASAIVDSLGNAHDLAISQAAATTGINTAAALAAGKVDAAGALAAAVGTDLTQAPNRATLLGQNATSLIGYRAFPSAPLTGSILRTLSAKLGEPRIISPEDFGGVADGLGNFPATNGVNPSPTDNAAAIALMLAQVGPNVHVTLNGVYATSQPIVCPLVNYVSIVGLARYTCGFLYTGASTTVDVLKIGDGSVEMIGWTLKNISIDTKTTMTAGALLHVTRGIFCQYENLTLHGQYGNLQTAPSQTTSAQKAYNGFFAQGFLYCSMIQPDIFVRNTALGLCGYDVGSGNFNSYGAAFFVYGGGKIGGSQTGILMGGGCYEVMLDEIDIIGNISNNIRMTQELYPHGNSILFCKSCTIDSIQVIAGAGDSVLINDVGDAFAAPALLWTGTWCASGPQAGIHIVNMGNNIFAGCHLVGCMIGNFQNDAIRVNTSIPVVDIIDCQIFTTNGVAINASGAGGSGGTFRNVRAKNVSFIGNVNQYSGNIEGLECNWTPVFGSDTGGTLPTQPTITYARYTDLGPLSSVGASVGSQLSRQIHFNISFTLPSSVPSGVGTVTLTLPWAADAGTSHFNIQGVASIDGAVYGIATGGTNLRLIGYPAFGVLKANQQISISGTYTAVLNGH